MCVVEYTPALLCNIKNQVGKHLAPLACPEKIIVNDFYTGAKYLTAGFQLISKPGIRFYVLVPLLINTLIFTGVIIYGAKQLASLIDWLSSLWSWTEWFSWLLWPLFLIITLSVVFFCFSILANLVSAPFNGFLAEAVAANLTGKKTKPRRMTELTRDIIEAIKSEATKFIYFIVRAIPLLLLLLIPILGPVIWFLFGAWMMALEYMDFPMGNNGMLFPEIRQTLASRRKLALGFGIAVMSLTLVPVINFIAMPVAVAGATKLWAEQIKEDNYEATE